MSSILEALKKLETENAARRDSLRIDAEILRTPPLPRISPIGIALAAALLFVCGGTVTYVYLNRNRPAPPLSRHAPLPQNARVDASRQSEYPAPTDAAPDTPETERRPVPSPDGVGLHRHPSVLVTPRTQVFPAPGGAGTSAVRAPTPEKTGRLSQQVPTPSAPTLRVDGIAFQDGTDGVAVVNGVPVSRGASIEGARVDEVQRDRVLFSHGGKKIEVFMGKSNR